MSEKVIVSRHAALIRRLSDKVFQYSADPILEEAASALREEIEAHDKTREERNKNSMRLAGLQGVVRGLEGKVKRLEIDLRTAQQAASGASQFAEGYDQGVKAVKDAVAELFETMGGGG